MPAACEMAARDKMISGNLAEYGEQARTLRWIDPAAALAAERERARLLAAVAPPASLAFKQTKPHHGDLSPGCAICGRGLVLSLRQRPLQLPLFLLPHQPG